jgi:UrcA family protein
MFTRLSKTAAVLSGVTASLMITTSATAQNQPVVVYGQHDENFRTARVSYADLNLATRGGTRTLNLRVSGAVKRVCLYNEGEMGLRDRGYNDCSSGAWAGAKPQIARAIARDQEIALTGKSSIAATAITISVPAL